MWKKLPPGEPGLYVASRERNADFVRAWTGKHWTPPVRASDVLAGVRVPQLDRVAARDEHGRLCKVEWLKPFVIPREKQV
jgi:hypothetical protein